MREESFIQYGYRKCRTHVQVLSQMHAHGNSKNERQAEKVNMENSKVRLNN